METKIVQMTPAIAREVLKRNTRNRKIRSNHVEKLRASFLRGEYRMTHQGVAIASSGELIDGQHRLTAISLMPDGVSFPMLVTTGLDFDEAFSVVDAVGVPRTAADVLHMDRKLVEVGMFLCRVVDGNGSGTTPTQIAPYVELTSETATRLNAFCSATCRTWSSAPVRCAAVVSIMQGVNEDFVKLTYRTLVLANFEIMTPVVMALFKSGMAGKVHAGNATDLFARSMRAFDPKNGNNSKIVIHDPLEETNKVRIWARGLMVDASKKNAPAKAGAKRSKAQGDSNSGWIGGGV